MSSPNLSTKNTGFIYRFVFETLSEGEGGTNGDAYVVLDKFVNELGKLQVNPALASVDPRSLQIPGVTPISSGCLINQVCYLELDTADAPDDSSFEQGDIDICYFYFDETFALPDAEKVPLRLLSGTKRDHWTFECTLTVFDATGPIAEKSFPNVRSTLRKERTDHQTMNCLSRSLLRTLTPTKTNLLYALENCLHT
jgi:hypothetical protein